MKRTFSQANAVGVRRAGASRPAAPRYRPGFSLIEVILATAILLGSVVMLSRLSGIGRTYAQNTDQQSTAQRICEDTMTEILMGIRPLQPVESQLLRPIRDAFDPRDLEQEQIEPNTNQVLRPARPTGGLTSGEVWRHSIRVKPEAQAPGLVTVTVEVSQRRSDGRGQTWFALTRWVRQEQQQDPLGGFDDSFGGDQR